MVAWGYFRCWSVVFGGVLWLSAVGVCSNVVILPGGTVGRIAVFVVVSVWMIACAVDRCRLVSVVCIGL